MVNLATNGPGKNAEILQARQYQARQYLDVLLVALPPEARRNRGRSLKVR